MSTLNIYEKQEEAKALAEEQSKTCSDRMVSGLLTAISSMPSHEGSVSKSELDGMSWVIFECWNQPLPFSKISEEMGKHMRFEETQEGFEWKVTKK
jgi:hypothetical protein